MSNVILYTHVVFVLLLWLRGGFLSSFFLGGGGVGEDKSHGS